MLAVAWRFASRHVTYSAPTQGPDYEQLKVIHVLDLEQVQSPLLIIFCGKDTYLPLNKICRKN